MLKKLMIGLLALTIVGGAAFALLDRQNTVSGETVTPASIRQSGAGQTGTAQPIQASVSSVGETWNGRGTILDLTSVGMTLALENGSDVYVELGSPEYWQAQAVTLNTGAVVTVDGFFNGTDYHARTVTTAEGEILALRNAAGQPLWAGGRGNGSGANEGQGQVQITTDQWVTLEGSITALTNNGLIAQTSDAQTLTISFGRADFWQDQAVTFAVGDAISLLGFWQGDQFSAGQVTKTATGERLLLRDPNGRPLWAGTGQGQGNGSGGQGNGNGGQGQHTAAAPEANPTAGAGQ